MSWITFLFLKFSPKNGLSRWMGWLALKKRPRFLIRWLMKIFAIHYELRLDEAKKAFDEFQCLDELFTRELREGIRPVGPAPVHPADGVIARCGPIRAGQLIQAKGWNYSVEELVGNQMTARSFDEGHFVTYYLCPTDYHRVHSPVDGRVLKVRYLPGTLWPVNPFSVEHIKNLFAQNERLVLEVDTVHGPVVVVMVGATNVGKMTLSFDPQWITNVANERQIKEHSFSPPREIKAGEEVGIFHLGSTVIVLYPSAVDVREEMQGKVSRLGESL